MFWLTGIVAAGAAWVINRALVKIFGESSVVFMIPVSEELIKTGVSILLKASLAETHGVFGFIEAVHDVLFSRRYGVLAGFMSIIAHGFFGFFTANVFNMTGRWLVAIPAAALLHMCWNYLMVTMFSRLSKR